MVEKQILETIKEHGLIRPHQHIILGLSGGPDSVCLFHVLLMLAKDMKLTLHPVHVNHQFRPGDAEEDQRYVEQLCRETGFPCTSFVIDCKKVAAEEGMTAEEAGRKARYASFSKVADALCKAGIGRENLAIATAHNADDQAETILFRILRGTGTDGLSGIGYTRFDSSGTRIIRPLLDVKKKEILAYCAQHNLAPRMDYTNQETDYTRNRIRLSLIPYLAEEYNPAVTDTMIRMGKAVSADSDCLWEMARDAYERQCKEKTPYGVLLDGQKLRSLHRAVRRRVLVKGFAELGLTEDLTWQHYQAWEAVVFHQSPSAACSLPHGYSLRRWYADVELVGRQDVDLEKPLPAMRIQVLSAAQYRQFAASTRLFAAFDYDLLAKGGVPGGFAPEEALALAFRGPGDFIAIGVGKTKKLQDYFVDRKIPKFQRDFVPLLKLGREVLWVLPTEADPQGRFSAKYKLCAATKKVICIEIIC